MRCRICGARAIINVWYARAAFCREHFIEFFKERVRSTLERYQMVRRGWLVLAAVSGGKDSAAMFSVLSELKDEMGFELIGVYLDLGIGKYSTASRTAVERLAQVTDTEVVTLSVKELVGASVPELARVARRKTCSVCGTVKRYLLNAAALEWGANTVALGHTMSDMAMYIVKEFLRQNLPAIAKLGPKTETIDGLAVGRIRPLYEVTERETLVYALTNKLPFYHEECPYVRRDSLNFEVKRALLLIEKRHPGTLVGLVRGVHKNASIYEKAAGTQPIKACSVCGLISSAEVCTYCRLTQRAFGEPRGSITRQAIGELRPHQRS